MKIRTFGSFCSGIGAPEVAWSSLGWKPRFFSEIEPFPCAVLAHHFPGIQNFGDMTAINTADLPEVDLWVAGTPCQAFSVAGLRRSLADDRGNLTLQFCRMIHERKPACVVWENVPGVLSTKDNAFGCFLAGLVGELQPLTPGRDGWADAGMVIGPERSAAWRTLDAQFFGLAQRRRRVFVVSFRTGDRINPGAVLFEPESLPRDSSPSREEGQRSAGTFAPRTHRGGGIGTHLETDGGLATAFGGNIAGTINAQFGRKNRLDNQHVDNGCPLFVPVFPLQEVGKRESKDQNGVGIGIGGGDEPMYTLQAGAQHGIAVPVAFDTTQITSAENGSNPQQGDPCHPLSSNAHAPAIAFQCHGSNGGQMGTLRTGSNEGGGVPFTLAVRGRESDHRLEYRQDGIANALMTPNGGRAGVGVGAVAAGMAVRRLMPVECEKLQGFPPGYTDITFKKKPAADGPRYRALGNSMAVPVVRWIGERIEKVLAAFESRAKEAA